MDVATKFEQIQQNIKKACDVSNRNISEVNLIGVTKYVTIERAKEAINGGVVHLGENRIEGFLDKYNNFRDYPLTWHFIGTLQSRKVKEIIDKVDFVHSLDRLSLAKEIDKRANKKVNCFIQVNVSGEASKHGIDPDVLSSFVEELATFSNIHVVGLMTMAPHTEDEQLIRNVFRKLAFLRNDIMDKQLPNAPCRYLSMGMSNDYSIAIEEGATHIRIGSKLVGQS